MTSSATLDMVQAVRDLIGPTATRILTLFFVVGAVLCVLFALFIKKLTNPRHLKSLPSIPSIRLYRELLSGTSFPKRYFKFQDELIKFPMLRLFLYGRWIVEVRDPDLARIIFTDTDTFKKFLIVEKRPYSTLAKFLGSNLVFSNGADWKRQRKVANPAFHRAFDMGKFAFVADELIGMLQKVDDKPVDVHDFMQRLTLDALCLMAFGFEMNAIRDPNNHTVHTYNTILKAISDPSRLIMPILERLPTAGNKKLREALTTFDGVMLDLIKGARQSRQAEDEPRHLLDMMVRSTEGTTGMTDSELLFNMKTFFLAGHDTTANAMACLLYFFAKHPDVQQKCREEVFSVCGKHEAPCFEQQKELVYMTQCIKETLRIYPSVSALPGRSVAHDTVLGGHELRTDDSVNINIFSIHRNPFFWPDPEKFDPERFSEENVAKHHPFQWIPFGGGQRLCIGMGFSLQEQRVVLSRLLQTYSFHMPDDAPTAEIDFGGGALLHPKNLKLQLRRL